MSYERKAVIADLIAGTLRPAEIAIKHGINVANVYTIKAVAKRSGIMNSRGEKSPELRISDESSVFTPEIRERIKDMRDEDLTTTEICQRLGLLYDQVAKVMNRNSSNHVYKLGKRSVKRVD